MHYKVKINSGLYERLVKLLESSEEAIGTTVDFVDQVNMLFKATGKYVRKQSHDGGLIAIQLREKPEGWADVKHMHYDNFYYPEMNEYNAEIIDAIENLPTVPHKLYNDMLAYKGDGFVQGYVTDDNEIFVQIPQEGYEDWKPIAGLQDVGMTGWTESKSKAVGNKAR